MILKDFFIDIFHSCYDMEWYREIRQKSWGAALRYLVGFHLLIVGIALVVFVPMAMNARQEMTTYLQKKIPDQTSVSIHNGQLTTTGLTIPYNVGVDEFPVIFDTSKTGLQPPDTLGTNGGIFFGRDAAFVERNNVEWRTYALKTFHDFSLTKEQVLGWLQKHSVSLLVGVVIAFFFLYFFSLLSMAAIYVIVVSLFVFLLSKLWKTTLQYHQWIAMGFHVITLPTIITMLASVFNVNIPFAFTFIYFMFTAAIIADERAKPVGKSEDGTES